MRYCLGFPRACKEQHNTPAFYLVLKTGSWNGIGGKIEGNETPLEAMARETKEDCPHIVVDEWVYFEKVIGDNFSIYCFVGQTEHEVSYEQTENDVGEVMQWWYMGEPEIAYNLHWLLPAACYPGIKMTIDERGMK